MITRIIFYNFVVGCIFQPALVRCVIVYSHQLLGARHTLIYLITISGTLDQLCKGGPLYLYSTSYSRLINLVVGSFTTGVLNYPVTLREPSHIKLEMHVRRCTSTSGLTFDLLFHLMVLSIKSNRLTVLNNKIQLDWLNLPFNSYK